MFFTLQKFFYRHFEATAACQTSAILPWSEAMAPPPSPLIGWSPTQRRIDFEGRSRLPLCHRCYFGLFCYPRKTGTCFIMFWSSFSWEETFFYTLPLQKRSCQKNFDRKIIWKALPVKVCTVVWWLKLVTNYNIWINQRLKPHTVLQERQKKKKKKLVSGCALLQSLITGMVVKLWWTKVTGVT